mmetsp:Transcript_4623/g.11598  ORF Transcript_4623/g.11598 Transcript_4623/m.11598 type:complete len:223 (+) Transcript_4623:682-1350(+)
MLYAELLHAEGAAQHCLAVAHLQHLQPPPGHDDRERRAPVVPPLLRRHPEQLAVKLRVRLLRRGGKVKREALCQRQAADHRWQLRREEVGRPPSAVPVAHGEEVRAARARRAEHQRILHRQPVPLEPREPIRRPAVCVARRLARLVARAVAVLRHAERERLRGRGYPVRVSQRAVGQHAVRLLQLVHRLPLGDVLAQPRLVCAVHFLEAGGGREAEASEERG